MTNYIAYTTGMNNVKTGIIFNIITNTLTPTPSNPPPTTGQRWPQGQPTRATP